MNTFMNSERRMQTGMVILFAIMSLVSSCSKSSMDRMTGGNPPGTSGGPGTNEVWIQGMAFNPSTITVSAGTTITWTNKDGVTHNVVSDTGLFSSGSMSTGATFSYKFTTAGTYTYKCTIHPTMTASVTVN